MSEPERPGKRRISVLRNGPYQVSGGIPLLRAAIVSDEKGDPIAWELGEAYEVADPYRLCRCGRSGKWPLCDGTHRSVAFDGSETDSRTPYLDRAELFEGPALRLTDVLILCADAGFCTREGGTWHLTAKSADPRARCLAIEQAGNCPSGRLVVWETDGAAIEPDLPRSVCVVENPRTGARGAYWARGRIAVYSAENIRYETRNRVTLCGCGRSRNKPFCDGTHSEG